MNYGNTIRTLRKKKQLSQKDLASRLEITGTYLSLLESGKKKPSLDMLEKISSLLGVPPYYLMLKSIDEQELTENKRVLYNQLNPLISALAEDFSKIG